MLRAQRRFEPELYSRERTAVDDLAHSMFSDDVGNDDSGYYGHQQRLTGQNSYEHFPVDGDFFTPECANDTPLEPLYESEGGKIHSEQSAIHDSPQENNRPGLFYGQSFLSEDQQPADSNALSEYDHDIQEASDGENEEEAFRRDMLHSVEARCCSDNLMQYMPTASLVSSPQDLEDSPGSVDIEEFLARKIREGHLQDRWQVDKESATLLASIVRDLKDYQERKMHSHVPEPLRNYRVEIPVLQCDPETDLRRLRARNEINIDSYGTRSSDLDDEVGEGLIWGTEDSAMPERVHKELGFEKMQVDAETVSYMKNVLGGTEQSLGDLLQRECEQKVMPRVSPTVLPLSPPLSPVRIPSKIAYLPLTSTPEDPTFQEAAELRAQIIARGEQDAQAAIEAGVEEMQSFLVNAVALSSTPLRKKAKALQSLRISSPLLPRPSSELSGPPAKRAKTVVFSDELQTIIGSVASPDDLTDPEVGAREATTTLTDMLGPLAQPTLVKLQSEELDELDTIARVPVPEVPSIKATAPWECSDSSNKLLRQIGEELHSNSRTWRGVARLEKDLPWVPFPSHLARIEREGQLDDGSCAKYLEELQLDGDFDVQRLIWKPEGLRLLDHEDDDEDVLHRALWSSDEEDLIPFGLHEGAKDNLQSVAASVPHALTRAAIVRAQAHDRGSASAYEQSSKLAVNAADDNISEATRSRFFSVPPRRRSRHHAPQEAKKTEVSRIGDVLALRKAKLEQAVAGNLASIISRSVESDDARKAAETSTTMDQQPWRIHPNAMEHFGQFLILQGQPDVPLPTEEDITPHEDRTTRTERPSESVNVVKHSIVPVPDRKPHSFVNMPKPRISGDDQRYFIAVSSAVMNNPHMVRKLGKLMPALEMVVRDSTEREREADVAVSTSTGVLLTNLQKLKQKPLPGQKAFFGIREQVTIASARYERLVVLVSEGKQGSDQAEHETSGLDQQDADALCEFVGCCCLLHAEVQVNYIPGGNEQLVDWLAAIITRHGDASTVLAEETYWERFLRKAGFNAFAAQFILSQLRVSSPDAGSTAGTPERGHGDLYGLPAFVSMSEDHRVQQFARSLGGDGMLRRVSKAIDGQWLSAANAMT